MILYLYNMNFVVTKDEYTLQLVNIITPHILEGFNSIYENAKKLIEKGEEKKMLKIFQKLIRTIPTWNSTLIEEETNRIRIQSKCEWINDLLKAVIKSNIILLTNTNFTLNKYEVNPEFLEIPLTQFIHRCYIESAKEIYNSPYLFYHNVKSIEKKRNQGDTINIIKNSIKEAVRKILPVKYILQKYLGEDNNNDIINFDKPFTEEHSNNIKKMVEKDLIHKTEKSLDINNLSYDTNSLKTERSKKMIKNINYDFSDKSKTNPLKYEETYQMLSDIRKKYNNGELISNIIKENNSNNDMNKIDNLIDNPIYNSNNTKDISNNNSLVQQDNKNYSISSISYKIESDQQYENVFSNMNPTSSEYKESINEKKTLSENIEHKKKKDNFFSKYSAN